MKRTDKKRIVVEWIILILLGVACFVYYLLCRRKWPLFLALLPYVYVASNWVIIFVTGKDIKDHFKEWRKRKPTLPQFVSDKATFEVTNTQELQEVAGRSPFLENLPTGAGIKEKKTWRDVEKEIYFSNLEPIDLSTDCKVFFITGKHGAGKSTYMLWSLSRYLHKEKSWQFKKVVFLNPDTPLEWASDLAEYDSEKTLLVIDALYRASDSDNENLFKNRCSSLFNLALGNVRTTEEGEDKIDVGPFKILATIREDEYKKLLEEELCSVPATYFCKYPIIPDRLDFKKILERLLRSYDVRYYSEDLDKKDLIEQLKTQSEGLPFYVRHLVICLKETKERFSKDTLGKFPPGMANLIWDTIRKSYYVENDDVIPFLLLLLLKTDKYFSKYLLDCKTLQQKDTERKVSRKIEILKDKHFQPPNVEDKILLTLSSHWKISLRTGLEHPDKILPAYRDVINSYRRIRDVEFNHLRENIIEKLKERLQEGFKDNADIFLCIDLAKLKLPESEESLKIATDIYVKHSSGLSPDEKEYVHKELCKLWISSAWKYRTRYGDENNQKVITCYENAFDKLGVRNDQKPLHAYAYFLQERILPKYNYGTPEFQECKKQIEKLYKEVIDIQPKDPISYQSLALFYADVGEEEEAEKNFEKSLEMDPSHIPSMQGYAIFLRDRGKREYDRKKALDYYGKAEKQFEKAISTLSDPKRNFSKKKFGETEKRLLNACALFLIEKTEWEQEWDKRKEIDARVDRLFEILLDKYQNHGQSVTAYSRFLMDFAWILDKYKCWEEGEKKNLRKARILLENFISNEEKKPEQELSYFMALHILALYYYRPKYHPQHDPLNKLLQRLQKAEECLKKSSTSFSDRHNSIACNELGRLYTQWARVLRNRDQCDYEKKMSLAKTAYEKAIRVAPRNRQSSSHLSCVYFNYAFYFQRMNNPTQSEECIQKALEVVKGLVPTSSYFSLTNLGTEFLREEDLDIAERAFIEAEKLQSDRINPSYALCRLGDIYGRKRDVEKALEKYLLSAQLENTSEGYGTRRHSIKQLMDDCDIRKETPYYEKCIQACIDCSKKAYDLDPNYWKNRRDYGKDLLETGDYTKAEEFFDKIAAEEDSAIGWFQNVKQMYDLEKYEKVIAAFQKFVEKYSLAKESEKEEHIFPYVADISRKVAESYKTLLIENKAMLIWEDYADVSFYSSYSGLQEGARTCGFVGNNLLKMKKFPEARECLLKSIRLCPDSAQNFSQLGDADRCLGRWQEGEICFKKALSLRSSERSERDKEQLEQCQQKQKENIEVSRPTKEIDNLIDFAVIEELEGRPEAALKYYEDALTLLNKQETTDNVKVYRFIADAFWGIGKADKSLDLYKKIKDRFEDYQKIIIETIIWLISSKTKKVERESLTNETVV